MKTSTKYFGLAVGP